MKSFLAIVLGVVLACQSASGRPIEVCFDDLGCFPEDTPCPDSSLPWRPEDINTQFYLYTRANLFQYEVLDRKNLSSVASSHYNASKGTKFIIHGYIDTIFKSWMRILVDIFFPTFDFHEIERRLLHKEDLNVIMVDWSKGAATLDYSQARQNMRVVGKEIAVLTALLNSQFGADFRRMHLIGHSLGAHIAGYAGAEQPGYGRITGLDPAGLSFRGVPDSCRLDRSDAQFVDCIHTDGDPFIEGGLGLMETLGDVDFYPNGGKDMPGRFAFLDPIHDHFYALYYFSESISSETCVFTAYPCDSWDNFLKGRCPKSCDRGECTQMGYNADRFPVRGSFYLITNDRSPYCISG